MNNKPRPLSPHLQVYSPQMTSMLSLFHRATGVALSLGLIVFVWWLVSLSIGGDAYICFTTFANSIIGKIMLAGWAWALCYHLCTGVRHLFWDMGYGFELPTVYKSAWTIIIVSTVLAVIVIGAALSGVKL